MMDYQNMYIAQQRHQEMLQEAETRRLVNRLTRTNRTNRRLLHLDLGTLHIDVTFGAPKPVTQM